MMEPWQEYLACELLELDGGMRALGTFIDSAEFQPLPIKTQWLMARTVNAINACSTLLHKIVTEKPTDLSARTSQPEESGA